MFSRRIPHRKPRRATGCSTRPSRRPGSGRESTGNTFTGCNHCSERREHPVEDVPPTRNTLSKTLPACERTPVGSGLGASTRNTGPKTLPACERTPVRSELERAPGTVSCYPASDTLSWPPGLAENPGWGIRTNEKRDLTAAVFSRGRPQRTVRRVTDCSIRPRRRPRSCASGVRKTGPCGHRAAMPCCVPLQTPLP